MEGRPPTPLFAAREAAGLTQQSLADALNVGRITIGRWERGVQSPQPSQRRGLAMALGLSLEDLDDLLRRTRPGTTSTVVPAPIAVQTRNEDSDASQLDVVHASIARLRRSLDRLDFPDDGPTRSLADLRGEIQCVNDDRLQARYRSLARRLPNLITELARACHRGDSGDRRHAAGLLTMALRAADGVAFKFGYLDLSARLIDLMRSVAQSADDPLLLAAVAYVRTEIFFASGDLDTAAHALEIAVDRVPNVASPPVAAAGGALHMRAAVVAGRAGEGDRAADHLREARRAAADAPEGIYYGTAFGPSSLRIHELAVAVELRDPRGIERAASWQPPEDLPAERRSHYYIDLARAQLALGHQGDARFCLEAARQVAPEHTRAHPQVRQSLSTLLRTHSGPDSGLLDLAAWAGAR